MEITNNHRALVALLQVPNFGLRTARLVLKHARVENAEELFNLSVHDIQRIDGIGAETATSLVKFDDWDKVDRLIEKAQKAGAFLVSFTDPYYPKLLRQIYDPPIVLWVKGDPGALQKQGVAIVGTRNPGKYGLQQAEKWSKIIAGSGLSINSGLAYGVDSKAHRTAVENGGTTVAVLGSGIDWIYPQKNRGLAEEICKNGGAVITEYPPGTKPDAGNFPERNRIVSGMSHGVLVIESGIKGGSMITARLALDQNREVFVIPHHLDYLKGEGCNYLIKTGQGKLVQTLRDVVEELSVELNGEMVEQKNETNKPRKWENETLTEEQVRICNTFGSEALHVDKLAEKLETEPFKLAPMLLEMEMLGLIKQKAGKYFELI
ncbi:DNA-processing protein DprA [soil metagenome]